MATVSRTSEEFYRDIVERLASTRFDDHVFMDGMIVHVRFDDGEEYAYDNWEAAYELYAQSTILNDLSDLGFDGILEYLGGTNFAFLAFQDALVSRAIADLNNVAPEHAREQPRSLSKTKDVCDPKGSIVLETFDIEGHKLPDALIFRAGAVQPYVVAHGYDAQTGEWSYGSYYGDPASAYEAANPEIIEEATIRWKREDIRERLESRGCVPNERNINRALNGAWGGRKSLAKYLREDGIQAGWEEISLTVSRLKADGELGEAAKA